MLSTTSAFCLLSPTGCRRGRPRMGEQVGDDMAAEVKVDEKSFARNTNYKIFTAAKMRMIWFCSICSCLSMVTEQSVHSIG